ncbi:MAG: DHA2 family efflux MFS transporter permease subunit [Solirubrobacterales bacterium]|nr:DHA2 family efflux MFS transporter permease subunit [Solirubrobacterales bacterium]
MNSQTREIMKRRVTSPTTVLVVSSLGVFMAFVDATIVNIAFPDIGKSFPDSDISSLSWVLNAYNIIFAAFLVAAGRIADLLGRRRIFLIGLVIFTLASVLCAVAPTVNSLIFFRVFQALGAAMIVPASLALVLNAYPAEHRAHAVALLSAIGALAAGIGPTLGGFLVSADSWRLVFLVNLPVGVAAYFLSRHYLVESREPGRRRMPDLPGALMFAVVIAALVLGVVQGDEWGWTSPPILASFGVALALGVLFVRRCGRHRSPIIDLDLLRIRTFSVSNSATVLAAAGFYGYTLVNVLFLTGVWQYSILEAGLAITPGPFVAAAVAGPTSRMAQRYGHRPVLVAGGLIWAAAIYWFVARVGLTPDFLGEWLPGMILLGIGAGSLFPNLSGAAVASAPGEAFGTATGLNSVARQVGAALGVAAVVAIIGAPGPEDAARVFDSAWTFSAVCLALSAVICLAVKRLDSGEDDVSRSPSLRRSTQALLAERRAEAERQSPPPPAPAARESKVPEPREPRPETAADFLGKAPLFAALDEGVRASIAERSTEVRLAAGDWLFHEGDDSGSLYVVRAGRLEVVNESDGTTIRVLGRGAALGELALLTSMPRSASIRAARDSVLVAIDRDEFDRLLEEEPKVAVALTRVLGSQLRDSVGAMPQSREVPVRIALVALDERAEVGGLARMLAESLSHHGQVELLDGSEIEASRAEVDPVAAYSPVLDSAERNCDQLILAGGSLFDQDPWTGYCLQQADRILAVGGGGSPERAADHPELRGCDLITRNVAPGSGLMSGWAEVLEPAGTHAIRSETLEADVARLARRLSGNSVGIVLSGGGARAFAHIGVLEELSAAGITIDRVGGVSMGAFVGAMFAMEMEAEEIDARCYEEWVRRRPLGDYTFPRRSLIRGDRARAMLERTFGNTTIEELGRGLFTGATELRSGELVVNRHGLLWEAVGTSFSLPVLAPPHLRGRQLLIDGSLVDNLPVETMAADGEGPVIAVDVKASFKRPAGERAEDQGAGSAPNDDSEIRIPGLTETLARVLLLGSSNTSEAARRHADWMITPQTEGVGLLEFHQLDAAREAGRIAAREALGEVPSGILL